MLHDFALYKCATDTHDYIAKIPPPPTKIFSSFPFHFFPSLSPLLSLPSPGSHFLPSFYIFPFQNSTRHLLSVSPPRLFLSGFGGVRVADSIQETVPSGICLFFSHSNSRRTLEITAIESSCCGNDVSMEMTSIDRCRIYCCFNLSWLCWNYRSIVQAYSWLRIDSSANWLYASVVFFLLYHVCNSCTNFIINK